jgi:hypothetical protein
VLEILLLFVLGKKIAAIAKEKNRSPVGYVLLLVFGWFILGFGGGVVLAIIAVSGGAKEDDALVAFIPGYLVGVVCAAVLAFTVVKMASPLRRHRGGDEYDDYDDYEEESRRRDDYDNDRPRRGRRDEDDDFDRPRRRDDY